MTQDEERHLIAQYSIGRIGSHAVLRQLGTADFGAIIRRLAHYDLPFPQAPMAGRKKQRDLLREAIRRAKPRAA